MNFSRYRFSIVYVKTSSIPTIRQYQTAQKRIRNNKKYPKAQKTASGLYYLIEKQGAGAQAAAGKTVNVHYTGTLADGTKFDSSLDRGQPISFQLGRGMVIRGWDEGIALFKVGGKGKLIIPSDLGYGSQGAGGVIPPNATLVFDIELVNVQ